MSVTATPLPITKPNSKGPASVVDDGAARHQRGIAHGTGLLLAALEREHPAIVEHLREQAASRRPEGMGGAVAPRATSVQALKPSVKVVGRPAASPILDNVGEAAVLAEAAEALAERERLRLATLASDNRLRVLCRRYDAASGTRGFQVHHLAQACRVRGLL